MGITDWTKEELLNELSALERTNESLKKELENTEALLYLTEEKLRKSITTSSDSVNINRLSDGLYVSINDGFTRTMGYTQEDVAGKTSLEMNIWNNPDLRKKLTDELKEKGRVENFEAEFLKKDGSIVNGLMSASIMELNGVPHILSITRDVTHHKQTENDLKREQYFIHALMEYLDDYIYFKDRDSRFLRINRSHATYFGLKDPGEAVGKTDFDYFTPEHARMAFNDEQNIMKTGIPMTRVEKHVKPGIPDKWSISTKLPLYDTGHNVIGTFGISRDITEQKKSEQQVLILANALKSIKECVSITDLDDRIIFTNEAFCRTYGFTDEELKNQHITIVRSENNPPEVIKEIHPATLNGGWSGELFNRKKDGTEFMLSLSTSIVKNDMGEPMALIGVASDITERKLSEEEIKFKNELLQDLNAEKDKFFSIIAHDLKGPLSSFVAATQMIIEGKQTMGIEEIVELAGIMKAEASSIYNLLENLLDWSRFKRGVMQYNPVDFLLREKVSSEIELLKEPARLKGISIEIDIPADYEVVGDINMLGTIIRNLASNALKFTNSGGKIQITASKGNNGFCEIEVSDTGIGIPPELQRRLFHLSEKTNRTGTAGEPSSGLGLLLCKEFIDKHGGRIRVESETGKGSRFIFSIPVHNHV
jgi:two-component system sensor histidine kinase/response regulator